MIPWIAATVILLVLLAVGGYGLYGWFIISLSKEN